jgi:hypothetical protein
MARQPISLTTQLGERLAVFSDRVEVRTWANEDKSADLPPESALHAGEPVWLIIWRSGGELAELHFPIGRDAGGVGDKR